MRIMSAMRAAMMFRSGIGAQIFFRVGAKRFDTMPGAKEIIAPVMRDAAGRVGGIDLHPAYGVNSRRVFGRGFVDDLTLGVHGYILALIRPARACPSVGVLCAGYRGPAIAPSTDNAPPPWMMSAIQIAITSR